MFLFLHTISDKVVRNLNCHYDKNGIQERIHGLKGQSSHKTLSVAMETQVVEFINNVSEARSIPLPGRLPNVKDYRVMKLPTNTTKSGIYSEYFKACEEDGVKAVSLTTFKDLWLKYCPYVQVMKPASDICQECAQNSRAVHRSQGMPDNIKNERLQKATEHLKKAKVQRNYYQAQCDLAKQVMSSGEVVNEMVYSFDYAQQVHYPCNAIQLGPAYFKTARKCSVFGVLCEGNNKQVNYLIDENDTTGKGADSVISMVHHYLQKYGQNERQLHLHADNCSGQNKNNAFMNYCQWRIAAGLCDCVEISFMLAGHTKFGPDRMFGLFKRKFGKCSVDTIDDIVSAVEASSIGGHNVAQLTCDPVSGERFVHWYNWSEYLSSYFSPIPNILSYQHFRFTKTDPGCVFMRASADAPELKVCVFKKGVKRLPSLVPTEKKPAGLSLERQWYLYEQIGPLCTSTLAASLTCPRPQLPNQNQIHVASGTRPQLPNQKKIHVASGTRPQLPNPKQIHVASGTSDEPPQKKQKLRLCRKCGQPGHNSCTCKS